MAYTIPITVPCVSCKGTGVRDAGVDGNGDPIIEDPCGACGGDGRTTTQLMDDTFLDDIMDKCNDIKEVVDEIKTVVDGL